MVGAQEIGGLRRRIGAFLEWLQPTPSGGLYFPEADGLRGLAVLSVILHHAHHVAGGPLIILPIGPVRFNATYIFGLGGHGVYLFFLLSGFLLSLPFLAPLYTGSRYPQAGHFYQRRMQRILPAYYACILLLVTLGSDQSYLSTRYGWQQILANATFLFNFWPHLQGSINPPFWTLSIEMQFYLLLPLFMYLGVRKRCGLAVAGVILAAALIWRYYVGQAFPENPGSLLWFWGEQLPYQLPNFGAGILVAAAYLHIKHRLRWPERRPRLTKAAASLLVVLGMVVAGLALYAIGAFKYWVPGAHYLFTRFGMVAGLAALLLGTLFAPQPLRWPWTNAPARFIGIVSYGMYLWHWPLLDRIATWGVLQGMPAPKQLQVLLVADILLAALFGLGSLVMIEKPFLRAGRRAPQPLPASQPPPAQTPSPTPAGS